MSEAAGPVGHGTEGRKRAIFLLWAVLLPLALMAAGVALAHFEVIAAMQGFLIYLLAGLVSLIHTALLLLMRFVLKKKPTRRVVAGAAVPFLLVIASASQGFGAPRINDISTDLENPPQFDAVAKLPANKGRDMSFPPAFAEEVRKGYPQLTSFGTSGRQPTQKEMFDSALEIAKSRPGWIIVRSNADEGIVEGTAETRLFRFRDDFVIRIGGKDGKTVLDMRSKSRDGKGDLGANAKRIEYIIYRVRAELGAAS